MIEQNDWKENFIVLKQWENNLKLINELIIIKISNNE